MYDYLKGKITCIEEGFVVLEVQSIGYKIVTGANKDVPPLLSEATFFTHVIYREPDITLYGFLSRKARDFFLSLLSISGVGPKTAITLLSHLSLEALHNAVLAQNLTPISSVPGIGKKTAERLLLELKSKLDSFPPSHDPAPNLFNDAFTALTHLGYSTTASQKALTDSLKVLPPNTSLSDLIAASLKVIAGRK